MKQEITGHTAFYCLLGSPVAHSISPQMYNLSFQRAGIDARYLAFDVKESELKTAVDGLRVMGVKGFNLTMPHKRTMVPLCDRLSPAAEICGAVNTVINENGILTGHTTDGIGYILAARDAGYEVRGKRMVQLGAGGAGASALVQAALDGAARIDLFNAHPRPELLRIVGELGRRTRCDVKFHLLSETEELKAALQEADLLVNTTPVGMAPPVPRAEPHPGPQLAPARPHRQRHDLRAPGDPAPPNGEGTGLPDLQRALYAPLPGHRRL